MQMQIDAATDMGSMSLSTIGIGLTIAFLEQCLNNGFLKAKNNQDNSPPDVGKP